MEILADFDAAKRKITGLSWWQSRRGRKIADGRILAKNAETIRARAKLGALSGLLAGLGWVSTIGVLIAMVLGWLGFPEEGESRSLIIVSWIVGTLMVGLGTLAGWQTAAVAAKQAALRGEGQWFQAIMRCRVLFFLLFFFTAIFGLTTSLSVAVKYFGPTDLGLAWVLSVLFGLMAPYAATLLIQSAIAAAVRVNRNIVAPHVPKWGIWTTALIASAGLPLVVPLALSTLIVISAGVSFSDWGEALWLTTLLFAIVVSCLA